MKIPLPNLDDRRWADLVEEGRSLIPVYAPDWTDHNVHDPGITLMELLAWIAEMDIYRLDRISDEHRRKFLSLVGITPRPPHPARTVLGFTLEDGAPSLWLLATAEFAGQDPTGQETRFHTLDAITVAPGQLKSVQVKDAAGFHDFTGHWQRAEAFGAFGAIPAQGSELYLGFSKAFGRNRPVTLYFEFTGPHSGEDERLRLIQEARTRKQACRPPALDISCKRKTPSHPATEPKTERVPPHHGVRTVWEVLTSIGGKQKWLPLDMPRQVNDDTRAFTLDGPVTVRTPGPMAKEPVGEVKDALYYLRCRFEAGAYDAPPMLQTVIMNGVAAEQSVPVVTRWTTGKGVIAQGPEPKPGDLVSVSLQFDAQYQITQLSFGDTKDSPKFRVLSYTPSSQAATGTLTLEAVMVGFGNGGPDQELALRYAPVQQSTFQLFTFEENRWQAWSWQHDFDASSRSDFHFLLDPTSGVVTFGDGEKGRVPPKEVLIFAVYRWTRAEAGNLAARTVDILVDSPHNRAIIKDFDAVKQRLQTITNPIPATGGMEAETLDNAAGRAIELMDSVYRAVTLEDYKRLALQTPGVQLARAEARANLHPSFPCLKAPGMITLIILPNMPVARPLPSPGLRRAVTAYLYRRRVVGTRVEVVGPTYLELSVHARVKALAGVSKTSLQKKIVDALNHFLDPLVGGPDGKGWPFGRNVYRSEVLQVIDEVLGGDHVFSLELIAEGCDPQCGNVCLAPTWLVTVGCHKIEVI